MKEHTIFNLKSAPCSHTTGRPRSKGSHPVPDALCRPHIMGIRTEAGEFTQAERRVFCVLVCIITKLFSLYAVLLIFEQYPE
jgi:hypothetical protein